MMIVLPDSELVRLASCITLLFKDGYDFRYIARDYDGAWYGYTAPPEKSGALTVYVANSGDPYFFIMESATPDHPCLIELPDNVLRSNSK